MAQNYTALQAFTNLTLAGQLLNSAWKVFGLEAYGTSGISQIVALPQTGLLVSFGAGEPISETSNILIDAFSRMNGQVYDPVANTILPAYTAAGTGGPTSQLLGTLGARNLLFELVYDGQASRYSILVKPGPSKYTAVAAATPTAIKNTGPGILHAVVVTTQGAADNVKGTFYDNASAASGSILGVIPPRNNATLGTGPGGLTGTVFTFNAPFSNGIYYDGLTNSPAIGALYTF